MPTTTRRQIQMYTSEYSYLWLIQAHEAEMITQLERRRIALERYEEALSQSGPTVRETGRSRNPIGGRVRRLVTVHLAPHD
jgi:hypothetical protein